MASIAGRAAQQLAQNRPGARGLLALESFADPRNFGSWPDGHAAHINGMADDEWFAEDRAADDAFVAGRADAELFAYSGDQHLSRRQSAGVYDEAAAALLIERVLAFLDRIG